jgi:hypothetical protein
MEYQQIGMSHLVLFDKIVDQTLVIVIQVFSVIEIHHARVLDFPVQIDDGQLAAVLETWVDAEHHVPTGGRGEKEVFQVFAEDL